MVAAYRKKLIQAPVRLEISGTKLEEILPISKKKCEGQHRLQAPPQTNQRLLESLEPIFNL
ncbi:hypothetical protein ES703_61176 [subsurface metagenome]